MQLFCSDIIFNDKLAQGSGSAESFLPNLVNRSVHIKFHHEASEGAIEREFIATIQVNVEGAYNAVRCGRLNPT
jgi:hypothetical protein